MYHNFFFYSSVNGHLGCFHVLAIVNSVAMSIAVHVFFSILVSSGYMSSHGIAGSSVQFSHLVVSDSVTPGLPVHQQLPEFTQTHIH